MLCKLAWGNVLRAKRDYLVYLLTLVLAVTVFYAFNTIAVQVDLVGVSEKGLSDLLSSLISGLTVFLGFVMGFLMVYANGYVMKRRKKEFGLYQVLGMSRGQVARIMALETLFVSLAALIIGIVCGVLLSQLMVFFTASLFKTQISHFHFFFSVGSFVLTAACLATIFLVTLLFNLCVVSRANVVDLMSAGRKNEAIKARNPWVAATVFVAGAAAIVWAYHRLLRDGLPIDGNPDAMQAFAITTAIVVAGTLLLFFGLSGFLLKVLQVLRGVYWRGLNMVTLRQLAAKVNTVSFSMGIIAMILFLAITSVVTGMSMASVMTSNIESFNPADYTRTLTYASPRQAANWNASDTGSGTRYAAAKRPVDILQASAFDVVDANTPQARPYDLASIAGKTVQVNTYDARLAASGQTILSLKDLCALVDKPLPAGVSEPMSMAVMKESDYNAYLRFRGMDTIDLGDKGFTITCDMGSSVNDIYNAVLSGGVSINIAGRELVPAQDRVNEKASSFTDTSMGGNSGTVIVPDAVAESAGMPLDSSYLLLDYADDITTEQGDAYVASEVTYAPVCNESGETVGLWGLETTRSSQIEGSNNMNGIISYLSIYIGFVLVIACASILTIQQLSSVADASRNYRILAELGTAEGQILKSVLVQQLVFFVFPLFVALAHSVVALEVVVKLVSLFGGLSIASTAAFTALVFLFAYGSYFVLCFFMGKGIVHDATHTRHA